MKVSQPKISILAARFVALSLCLWLSGAACLLVCGTTEAQSLITAAQKAEKVENLSCPMHHRQEDSGKTTGDASESLDFSTDNAPQIECCTFANYLAYAAKKAGSVDYQFTADTVAPLVKLEIAAAVRLADAPIFYQSVPINRGKTYLRLRVFRI